MTLLAPSLQSYFTDHACAQRDLSPNTISASEFFKVDEARTS